MSIVIDGTLGVSAVQDGIISESKIATGAVTDTKLTLTPNSQEVKDALNATGSAPIYACRAWVNFNGTGTVAIRASGNVSSITDNGTGNYTINFTTAMPDANYTIATNGKVSNSGFFCFIAGSATPTTSGVQMITRNLIADADADYVLVSIFR